jgi:mannan endo-1,4-beta-mannosidase
VARSGAPVKDPGVARPDPRRGSHRMRSWYGRHVTAVMCAAVVVCAAVLVVVVKHARSHAAPSAPAPAAQPLRYLGVYEPGSPRSYAGVDRFAQMVGRSPNLALYYSGWPERFKAAFAQTAAAHGATTLVEMDPSGVSLDRIASGTYDRYLVAYARAVAKFGKRVVISFGHEMNGYWYSWGYHHSSPASFIAAWRHVVTLFRQHGATNAMWLWQVNSASTKTGPVHDWWPGASYVDWVGVSGYYFVPTENFSYIFEPVIASVRKFTNDPVLIAETASAPGHGQAHRINDLFTGARKQHYLGLVWFDHDSSAGGGGGPYTGKDWRLEGHPAEIKAFRAALAAK